MGDLKFYFWEEREYFLVPYTRVRYFFDLIRQVNLEDPVLEFVEKAFMTIWNPVEINLDFLRRTHVEDDLLSSLRFTSENDRETMVTYHIILLIAQKHPHIPLMAVFAVFMNQHLYPEATSTSDLQTTILWNDLRASTQSMSLRRLISGRLDPTPRHIPRDFPDLQLAPRPKVLTPADAIFQERTQMYVPEGIVFSDPVFVPFMKGEVAWMDGLMQRMLKTRIPFVCCELGFLLDHQTWEDFCHETVLSMLVTAKRKIPTIYHLHLYTAFRSSTPSLVSRAVRWLVRLLLPDDQTTVQTLVRATENLTADDLALYHLLPQIVANVTQTADLKTLLTDAYSIRESEQVDPQWDSETGMLLSRNNLSIPSFLDSLCAFCLHRSEAIKLNVEIFRTLAPLESELGACPLLQRYIREYHGIAIPHGLRLTLCCGGAERREEHVILQRELYHLAAINVALAKEIFLSFQCGPRMRFRPTPMYPPWPEVMERRWKEPMPAALLLTASEPRVIFFRLLRMIEWQARFKVISRDQSTTPEKGQLCASGGKFVPFQSQSKKGRKSRETRDDPSIFDKMPVMSQLDESGVIQGFLEYVVMDGNYIGDVLPQIQRTNYNLGLYYQGVYRVDLCLSQGLPVTATRYQTFEAMEQSGLLVRMPPVKKPKLMPGLEDQSLQRMSYLTGQMYAEQQQDHLNDVSTLEYDASLFNEPLDESEEEENGMSMEVDFEPVLVDENLPTAKRRR